MKQQIKLPLYSIFSLIHEMEELAKNPATAELYKNMQDALDQLKVAFKPLLEEFANCLNIPDVDATIDTEAKVPERSENTIDWEQRRFELIKSAMQGRLASVDHRFGFQKSFIDSIARDSVKMADSMLEQLKRE